MTEESKTVDKPDGFRFTVEFTDKDGKIEIIACDKWMANEIRTSEKESLPMMLLLDEGNDVLFGRPLALMTKIDHNYGGTEFFAFLYESMFTPKEEKSNDPMHG